MTRFLNRNRNKEVVVIAYLKVLSLVLFVIPFGVRAEVKGVSWEDISIQIEPAKPSFLLGEPVTVVVQLMNMGEQPVPFSTADLGLEYDTSFIRISASDREEIEYRTWFVIEPSAPSFALAPGDRISFSQTIHWNAETDHYAFPEPGTYGISVGIYNLTGEEDLTSESTPVRIIDLESAADREIVELMTDRAVAGFLAGVSEPDTELLTRLQKATESHPNAIFIPYIHYGFALYYSREYFERQPDLQESRSHLQQVLQLGGPQHPLRANSLSLMARVAIREGNIADAERLVQEARQIRAGDLEILQLGRMIEKRSRQ